MSPYDPDIEHMPRRAVQSRQRGSATPDTPDASEFIDFFSITLLHQMYLVYAIALSDFS